MTARNGKPPMLTGCDVLPPMEPAEVSKPKRKPDREKTGNRFAVLNAFVDCSLRGLTKAELATWLILYRDTREGTVSTSQANIARRAGISVRSVGKAISKLTMKGLLTIVFRGGLNRNPSRYRVNGLRNQDS
jgi:hypothetical protein